MTRFANRPENAWVSRFTQATCRLPTGHKCTISPCNSSTRSSSDRMPEAAIRWYSSAVNCRRVACEHRPLKTSFRAVGMRPQRATLSQRRPEAPNPGHLPDESLGHLRRDTHRQIRPLGRRHHVLIADEKDGVRTSGREGHNRSSRMRRTGSEPPDEKDEVVLVSGA
jgi:hypothetical protein